MTPMNTGWLILVKPEPTYNYDNLMSSEEYKSKVAPT